MFDIYEMCLISLIFLYRFLFLCLFSALPGVDHICSKATGIGFSHRRTVIPRANTQ